MARSKLDTLVYSTILIAPMVTALLYIATTDCREPEPVLVVNGAVDRPESATREPAPVIPAIVEPTKVEPTIAEPPAIVDEPNDAGAGVLLHDGRLVFSTAPELAWAKGALRSGDNEYGVTLLKSVDLGRLPGRLAALADQRFTVYAADGSTCLADAGPLSIVARVDGDLAIYGDGDEDASGLPLGERTDEQLAALHDDVFKNHANLLLSRPRNAPRCTGLWARQSSLPAPAVFGARTLSDDVEHALAAELSPTIAAHSSVVALAASYTAWYEEIEPEHRTDVPAWTEYLHTTTRVRRWDEVGGARSLVTVDIGTGGEACTSDFSEHTSLVLEQRDGAWQLLDEPGFWRPEALMDLDRDGHLEAVTDDGRTLDSHSGLGQSFTIPFWGCPC